MGNDRFFDEAREQSLVKTTIVSKYFWAWAKVIIPTAKRLGGRIAYIDLFAGPGRYKDGTRSTPLLVLEQAIKDDDMRQMLVTIFNDADTNNTQSLETAIRALSNIDSLKYKPQICALTSVAKGASRCLTAGLSEKASCRNSCRVFIWYDRQDQRLKPQGENHRILPQILSLFFASAFLDWL